MLKFSDTYFLFELFYAALKEITVLMNFSNHFWWGIFPSHTCIYYFSHPISWHITCIINQNCLVFSTVIQNHYQIIHTLHLPIHSIKFFFFKNVSLFLIFRDQQLRLSESFCSIKFPSVFTSTFQIIYFSVYLLIESVFLVANLFFSITSSVSYYLSPST